MILAFKELVNGERRRRADALRKTSKEICANENASRVRRAARFRVSVAGARSGARRLFYFHEL
jgi:hypothetical protein